MSNTRRARSSPRPPDPVERAFADELRRGCPECGSRRVIPRFRGTWSYTLACLPACPTHADQAAAHRIAADAARRAAEVTGQDLSYRAIDGSAGRVEGVVVSRAGAGA